MFDIGFWELVTIAVIGIVVVGPDKLPQTVRTVMGTVRKFRRMFDDVKGDIERELNLDEMRRQVEQADIEAHIRELNQSVLDAENSARQGGKALLDDIDRAVNRPMADDEANSWGVETGWHQKDDKQLTLFTGEKAGQEPAGEENAGELAGKNSGSLTGEHSAKLAGENSGEPAGERSPNLTSENTPANPEPLPAEDFFAEHDPEAEAATGIEQPKQNNTHERHQHAHRRR